MTDRADVAPWIQAQAKQLLGQRGHAWLLQGPSGLGQYSLALALAQAWLCESPSDTGACGSCPSCHAIAVRTHADLYVLMPEVTMQELAWPLSEKAQADIDDKKRKPSKEIRVDAMRDAVEFSQRTSSRGRGKVVLVFPAEDMNAIAANALLKTLEEPAGDVRFVLATSSAHALLPTIRSRCIGHTMVWPPLQEARQWLLSSGITPGDADSLLAASGGRPDDALQFAHSGRAPQDWGLFPKAMVRGDVGFVKDWSPVQLIDGLHKLSHDVLAQRYGAQPRFFDSKALPSVSAEADLTGWARRLARARQTMEHPFNAGLMLEALVAEAKTALNSLH